MPSSLHITPLLAAVATLAAIGVAVFILRDGAGEAAPQLRGMGQPSRSVDVALKKARFSEIKGGQVAWELTAERVEYDKGGGVARLTDGIRIDFSKNGPRDAVTVTAQRGDYLSAANLVQLRGKVHLQSGNGATFDTESLDYTSANSRFTTAAPVTYSEDRLRLKSTGMELGVKEQSVRFLAVVDATVSGVAGK
ncbi:MAG TPA: LPS export ABC transporter periplasmic protein LptC [Desulfuromonadales bacterium]|nr:LPS export ABC transporter periplasmic protein LptC [Desulfuromonadales bacterium]